MAEMSESYSVNDTKFEEHLEESLISQNDYKKLKQENEDYRQELHVLRLKLETSDAVAKDLQESYEILEKKFERYMTAVEDTRTCTYKQFVASNEEYENRIADLKANIIENEKEIKELKKELKIYKDIPNKGSCCQIAVEEALALQEKKIAEMTTLLYNEKKNVKDLEDKLMNMMDTNQELNNNLHTIMRQLMTKEEELENAQESARGLAINLQELEQSKEVPASDTCKGNSLFAEVEDRRQILLDKMKVLTNKYNEAKRALNTKISEVKLLRTEKSLMARKWEVDMIDTLQENAHLLEQYKKRIFELENKLKVEIKKKNEMEETLLTDDGFNYTQRLLLAKGKEIKELNEKMEKQAMQILVQKEAKRTTSRELRYWRSKAMSLEAQIQAIKAQLEAKQTNDDIKTLLEAIENCKITGNVNFEESFDDSGFTFEKLMPKNDIKEIQEGF